MVQSRVHVSKASLFFNFIIFFVKYLIFCLKNMTLLENLLIQNFESAMLLLMGICSIYADWTVMSSSLFLYNYAGVTLSETKPYSSKTADKIFFCGI
jgi:hypothetical protein